MTPLTPEQQALAADPANVSYALAIAHRWAKRRPSLADEFESVALVGLVQAARTFDPSLGIKFRQTHLVRRVNAEIIDVCRMWKPQGFRRKGEAAVRAGTPGPKHVRPALGNSEGDVLTWGSVPSGDLPVGWEAESEDEVLALARTLPSKYGRALRLYYTGAGKTLRAVGEEMGVCEASVWHMIDQALRWLRKERAA